MTMMSTMQMCMPFAPAMQASFMPVMMARMAMETKSAQAVCRLDAVQGLDKELFQQRCEMMQMMLDAGMPVVIQCANVAMVCVGEKTGKAMPMMLPAGILPGMVCTMAFDVEKGAMLCRMAPGQEMDKAMFDSACSLMDKLLRTGMPATLSCNGAPMLCCTH